jgi:hypothetical protein
MISLGPAKDALAKLQPPSPDAAFLKTAMDLAKSGNMYQNPMAGSFSAIDGLGLDSAAATFAKIPGCSALAAQCANVTSSASAVKSVSTQMFTSVMPTSKTLPPELMAMSPSLSKDDKEKLADFSLPSITDVVATAQTEQEDNERMGTSGDNPCLPVQKTMEATMAMARKMESGINDIKDSLQSGMKQIQDAYDAVQNATSEGLAAATAALTAAVNSVSGSISAGLDKVGKLVSDAGKSLVESIKTVRDSVEKSMNLAIADMAKSLIANNPCMKEVLSPGEDMFETTCEVKIRNDGPDLKKSAALLLVPSNLKVSTNLSSMGYETWKYETVAQRISDTETQAVVKLTYTIDRKKAKGRGSPMDTIEHMTSIKLVDPEEEYPVGYLFVHESFINLESDSPTLSNIPAVKPSYEIEPGYLKLVEAVEWRGAKKVGLLSPQMQKIAESPAAPEPELTVTKAKAVVITEEQVKVKEEKTKAEMIPPVVKEEVTEVVKPKQVPTVTPVTPFGQSVIMKKEKIFYGAVWDEVRSVDTVTHSGRGMLSVMFFNNKDQNTNDATFTYELWSSDIDALIAEAKSKNITKPTLYYQAIEVRFFKKDGTLFGSTWMYFYMGYIPETNQVVFETTTKTGDSEKQPWTWTTTRFVNDKANN